MVRRYQWERGIVRSYLGLLWGLCEKSLYGKYSYRKTDNNDRDRNASWQCLLLEATQRYINIFKFI